METKENPFLHPVTFEVTERQFPNSKEIRILIGNSGGKYVWEEGTDFFRYDFNPDGSNSAATDEETQRKHTTLYPAVLWHFLEWRNNLPESDKRKQILKIFGITNAQMSRFGAKLLNHHYSSTCVKGKDRNNPHLSSYEDTINIASLVNDSHLMRRLKFFADRAERMQYTTFIKPPIK